MCPRCRPLLVSLLLLASASTLTLLPSTAGEQPPRWQDAGALLDRENGLGRYHFGDRIKLFPHLKEYFSDGTTISYTDPDETLSFQGIPLTSIFYTFKAGQLETIALDTKGPRNSTRLEQALVARYGPGEVPPAPLDGYVWQGRRVILSFSPATPHNDAAQAVLMRREQ